MKIKVNVFLNRIPATYQIQDSFTKAQAYYLKHGVEFEFIFQTVSVGGYTSVWDNINGRWLLQGSENLVPLDPTVNATMFVFDQAEWSNPSGSQYPLKPNTPNGNCKVINGNKFFINIGVYKDSSINTVEIEHEPMHMLRIMANCADVMDRTLVNGTWIPYYHNDDPDYPNGNFAQQWALLEPYLKSLQAPQVSLLPKVLIIRAWDDGVQTLGDLTTNGFACKTLERPWWLNQPNISCIPRGKYLAKWTFSYKFMRYTYQIQNVPGRSGIRIHSGNYFFDIDGCIILGEKYGDLNHDQWADIINSKVTVAKFEQVMGKKDFQLEII